MASGKTRQAVKVAFNRFADRADAYNKWDFYGDLFPLIESRRITFKEAHEITKEQCEHGVGIKRVWLMDRINYFRMM